MRKTTVFILCPKHKAILQGESRNKKARFMTMGGYVGHAPCDCKIKLGTDLFVPSFVERNPGVCGILGK